MHAQGAAKSGTSDLSQEEAALVEELQSRLGEQFVDPRLFEAAPMDQPAPAPADESPVTALEVLSQSLAIANAESEAYRRQAEQLQLKIEALGLESANPDRSVLEERLLSAVNDLRLQRDENEALRDQILKLKDAMLGYLVASETEHPELRMVVEEQLRASDAMLMAQELGYSEAEDVVGANQNPLDTLRVVSIKEEWALLVINKGRTDGIRVGMPLAVMREGRAIAEALVVDVRDRICGAVLHNQISPEFQVQIGDRLRPIMF